MSAEATEIVTRSREAISRMLADAAQITDPEEAGAIQAIAHAMQLMTDALERSANLAAVRLARVQFLEAEKPGRKLEPIRQALETADRSVSWEYGDPWGSVAMSAHADLRQRVAALLTEMGVES